MLLISVQRIHWMVSACQNKVRKNRLDKKNIYIHKKYREKQRYEKFCPIGEAQAMPNRKLKFEDTKLHSR